MDHLHRLRGHTCERRELHSCMKTPWDHLNLGITVPDDPWFQTHPHGRLEEARGNEPCRRPKAQLRCDVADETDPPSECGRHRMRAFNATHSLEGLYWRVSKHKLHDSSHHTGLHSPHQGHHSYILKLKPEKSGTKRNYFHPVWLS